MAPRSAEETARLAAEHAAFEASALQLTNEGLNEELFRGLNPEARAAAEAAAARAAAVSITSLTNHSFLIWRKATAANMAAARPGSQFTAVNSPAAVGFTYGVLIFTDRSEHSLDPMPDWSPDLPHPLRCPLLLPLRHQSLSVGN